MNELCYKFLDNKIISHMKSNETNVILYLTKLYEFFGDVGYVLKDYAYTQFIDDLKILLDEADYSFDILDEEVLTINLVY